MSRVGLVLAPAVPLSGGLKTLPRFGVKPIAPSTLPETEDKGWAKPPLLKRMYHFRYRAWLSLLGALWMLPLTPWAPKQQEPPKPPESSRAGQPDVNTLHPMAKVLLLGHLIYALGFMAMLMRDSQTITRRKTVYHELGHLLVNYRSGLNLPVERVYASDDMGQVVFKEGDLYDIPLFLNRLEKSPEPLKEFEKLLQTYKAGEMMERLVYGHGDLGSVSDKFWSQFITARMTFTHPKWIVRILGILLRNNAETAALIRSMDRKMIDELANKLEDSRVWGRTAVQRVLKDYQIMVSPTENRGDLPPRSSEN